MEDKRLYTDDSSDFLEAINGSLDHAEIVSDAQRQLTAILSDDDSEDPDSRRRGRHVFII